VKQVAQRLRDGRVEVLEVPEPELSSAGGLVDVRASLLSAGTERSKVETGRKSLLAKARARPDQVRQVLDKARRDGLAETVAAVRARLDQPAALGYSAAGIVLAVGSRVRDLVPGDAVACGGGGYAVHAEIDHVPANLCARLPAAVEFGAGAFATVGAIALHGVRQADVHLGERVAVIGLGLVGQLTGQILRAGGCRVVGVDLDGDLVARALEYGAADEAYDRASVPGGAGACDAAIVTAAAPSADPVSLAIDLCRDRGRIVVVGAVAMELDRQRLYEKELELRLSRSYGPGRYDAEYEERGLDYPIGYVRWTERRNMDAFLALVAAGKVRPEQLVTARFPIDRAPEAYELLLSAERSPLGILIEYGPTEERRAPTPPPRSLPTGACGVAVVGAGSFANRILVPGLRRAGFELRAVASATGLSARGAADRFGFAKVVTVDEAIGDPDAGVVAIATRHDSHAELAAAALEAGKAVFVEKPPCLTEAELERLREARATTGLAFVVGFNRRHAELACGLHAHMRTGEPIQLLYRVNADRIDADHWLNDPAVGGGRLLGEGCHFVDFACWIVGSLPVSVSCTMRPAPGRPLAAAEEFSVVLAFADGSTATIVYGAAGAPRIGKEYVEAHGGGRSAILRDFRVLELYDGGGRHTRRSRGGDKGHAAQFEVLRRVVAGQADALPPDPLETMGVTLASLRSAEVGAAVPLAGATPSSAARTSTIRPEA
jgi:predicted dehydrogenase